VAQFESLEGSFHALDDVLSRQAVIIWESVS
jgi:hypothetical protein